MPGMSVRLTDIDVTDINSQVEKRTIDEMLTGLQCNHGCAGPVFCDALIRSGYRLKTDELRFRAQEAAKNLVGPNSNGALERAAMPPVPNPDVRRPAKGIRFPLFRLLLLQISASHGGIE